MPLATPAGIFSCLEMRSRTRPWPLQSMQGSSMVVPKPRQAAQVSTVIIWPRKERTGRWIWPAPRQMVQVTGEVPGRQQLPWQVEQVTAVSISSG